MPSDLKPHPIGRTSPRRRFPKVTLAAVTVASAMLLAAFSARAWQAGLNAKTELTSIPSSQSPSPLRDRPRNRLGLQPEADKLRRRLGQRFLTPGREVSVIIGQLVAGSDRYVARIVRRQDDDDERLTIALNGEQTTYTWSGTDGARAGGNPAAGNVRALIERLALDSPDQFVLAQLRGSTYFTVAQSARPEDAGGSDTYSGPLWDLVRVAEPSDGNSGRPLGLWRLYYVNTSTGLIDRIVSQEQGRAITAELSGWINQSGEWSPTRITWKQDRQTVMELSVTNISQNPRQ